MRPRWRWPTPAMAAGLSVVLLWLGLPGGGGLWPLLLVALVPLLVVAATLAPGRAWRLGFLAGVAHQVVTLYWIVIVLGRYGGLPLLVTVPALLLLAAYMALYLATFLWGARQLFQRMPPLASVLLIPGWYGGLDWLRGQLFSGFPWLDLGYGLAATPWLLQSADLFGHIFLTYLLVLTNTALALCFLPRSGSGFLLGRQGALATVLLILVASGGYSAYRWQQVSNSLMAPTAATMRIGIVQGNVDQSQKWLPELQQQTVDNYLRGSVQLQEQDGVELVVWPETALPFYPAVYPGLTRLQSFSTRFDVALLTGSPWFEVIDRTSRDIKYYNSAQLLLPDGRFGASYYKTHLVPFGEYVPLRAMLPFLEPLVEAAGDFTPGRIGAPLEWRHSRLGVLICFEAIFPELARRWVENGANVLVNLTNDAWYGKSSAPHHSMAMAVLRAVETRRGLVRSANTGISGFVDPLGRVSDSSPLFTFWVDSAPVVLREEVTVFVRFGHLFGPLCLLLSGGGLLVALWSSARRKTNGRGGGQEIHYS